MMKGYLIIFRYHTGGQEWIYSLYKLGKYIADCALVIGDDRVKVQTPHIYTSTA